LLLDRPRSSETSSGKMHSILVRRILESAHDLESAIGLVQETEKSMAWSLCISHASADRLCYIEYDGQETAVQRDREMVLSTNHCLLHPPRARVAEHSQCRFRRLEELLISEGKLQCTTDQAQRALRDRFDVGRGRVTAHLTMNTVQRVDNHASIV